MWSVDKMIARKHSSSRGRIYKCPMQSQTLQVMGRSNTSEHEIRNTGVEEIEVGEILDGYRLECEVPIMVQTRTRCFKVRLFRSSTVHISTVSGTGRPYKLRVNLRSWSNAEIPLEERSFPLYSWSKQGKEEECDTHMRPSPWRYLCVLRRASTISTCMSGYPIHSKFRNALNAVKDVLNISMNAIAALRA